jgi:3-methyladenine DNA glycosylase AlkD
MQTALNQYISLWEKEFRVLANPEIAQYQKAYLRNQFDFLGIKTPELRLAAKSFLLAQPIPQDIDFQEFTKALFALNEREFQHLAIEILSKKRKKFNEDDIDLLEYLIIHKSWWDTVDAIAHLVGSYFTQYPDYKEFRTEKWLHSGNMWLQRVAIIFQIGLKKQTDESLLFKNIVFCIKSQAFFIQKAIGWALREYGKTNPQSVFAFAQNHPLAPLSKREALRRIIK